MLNYIILYYVDGMDGRAGDWRLEIGDFGQCGFLVADKFRIF